MPVYVTPIMHGVARMPGVAMILLTVVNFASICISGTCKRELSVSDHTVSYLSSPTERKSPQASSCRRPRVWKSSVAFVSLATLSKCPVASSNQITPGRLFKRPSTFSCILCAGHVCWKAASASGMHASSVFARDSLQRGATWDAKGCVEPKLCPEKNNWA